MIVRTSGILKPGVSRVKGHRVGVSFWVTASIYFLLAATISVSSAQVLHKGLVDSPSPRAHSAVASGAASYLVLIVLDGGRPDYLHLTKLPHLDALRTGGTQYTNTIDGILESETPAGHTTLTTGSGPSRNGVLGFNWAQNDNDFSLFSPSIIRSGALDRIIRASRVPTLAGLYKAQYPKAKVVALSGHKYYAADALGGPSADVIMYFQGNSQGHYVPVGIPGHMPPASILTSGGLTRKTISLPPGVDNALAARLAIATFRVMRQRMTLINEPEFDWPLGHVFGGSANRSRVIGLMKAFDHDLGTLENSYRKAGILKKTLFVITADHGMAPVTHFISSKVITDAVAKANTSAPSVAYNQAAFVWLKDLSKAELVAKKVVASKEPGLSAVYSLSRVRGNPRYLRSSGIPLAAGLEAANQHLLKTLLNGHEPSVVAFARTDATFSSSGTHWRGDHGGGTWQSQHIPLVLSGPGIQAGKRIAAPAQLQDVAPTILTAMGVRPTGMQGQILTEALRRSGLKWRRDRTSEAARLQPVVRALQVADKAERSHPLG